MFHSGKWTGHWEQKGFGRQSMHQLLLTFSDGQIVGEGRDMLGEFIFIGTYEPGGIIRMVKQYIGKHAVFYTGAYDGEGTISGEWMVAPGVVGPFALQPLLPPSSTADLPIQDL
jgi:hypothetical protein